MIEFPQFDPNIELTDEALNERIKQIDALIPSPEQRAGMVLKHLQTRHPEFSTWDVVCFCSEFLGMMIDVLPFLAEEIKNTAVLVQIAHYRQPELISGLTGDKSQSDSIQT